MRQLASIKRISEVRDIPNKDKIGLALIDGWSVIVQKSEFKAGDLCVFCEIDSILPDKPEFEFLKNGKGLRIKTMKMAGCISQGICFPLSILPEGNYADGQDVTDVIGVTKYEPDDVTDYKPAKTTVKKYPKCLMRFWLFRKLISKKSKKIANAFPDFVSKTDETRIQNAPWYLESNDPWIVTEKVDGQSGTFAMVHHPKKGLFSKESYEYIVCSRNVRLFNRDSSSYWAVSDKYNLEYVLKQLIYMLGVEWVAIQGECIAPGVQGNKYKVTEPDLYVFNLITPTGRWGSLEGRNARATFGMKWVPILQDNYILPSTVEQMLDFAHGKSQLGDTIREGVVCRSQDGRKSFKAVDPLFLMKYDA